jgi:hypothetical protein
MSAVSAELVIGSDWNARFSLYFLHLVTLKRLGSIGHRKRETFPFLIEIVQLVSFNKTDLFAKSWPLSTFPGMLL